MITYYGDRPDGRPMHSSHPAAGGYVYFAWDGCVGRWVDRSGRFISSSRFMPSMSIFTRWMPTYVAALDEDYRMDEGL